MPKPAESVYDLHIVVVGGMVMDFYGIGIKLLDNLTEEEIYALAAELCGEPVRPKFRCAECRFSTNDWDDMDAHEIMHLRVAVESTMCVLGPKDIANMHVYEVSEEDYEPGEVLARENLWGYFNE